MNHAAKSIQPNETKGLPGQAANARPTENGFVFSNGPNRHQDHPKTTDFPHPEHDKTPDQPLTQAA
jgi:hypothetical protein